MAGQSIWIVQHTCSTELFIGAGEVAYGQPRVKDGCCNVQWVLFGFGWVLGLPWILGFLLPMCSYQRLKAPSYR